MRKTGKILQVSFTYIGTVVGAGFATGQEILQFFTRFGSAAAWTIALSCLLFTWIGIKLMLLANEMEARSYEDLNRMLFGERIGNYVSLFTMIVLFGVTTIMLAGAGSLFTEQLNMSYQAGLWLTIIVSYFVLSRGIHGILTMNSIVVPVMMAFSILVVWTTLSMPNADYWLKLSTDSSSWRIWFSPFLYTAFNLAMAQAVLVPLGSAIRDRSILFWGGLLGGVGISLMLLAAHIALAARMPGIVQFEIPMGQVIHHLGPVLQLMYVFVIFGEIFTTFVADAYGLTLQLEQRTKLSQTKLVLLILLISYLVSQIGFSKLLSVLYPLFGGVSLLWLIMMLLPRSRHTGTL
ncbi:hypothetical protein [Paenibacillus sp. J2TS4]|uniref:YkvI family membrane protein n=1 Tax=Paenibacillus sp. J2TS4 TaxID=2807194 RepID=UPI001B02F562|nr:hypothetical protein [Paenibacillus sp. J2TS4]GIP33959.1 membrane protein [Paenibacillus sp. J2TS4]